MSIVQMMVECYDFMGDAYGPFIGDGQVLKEQPLLVLSSRATSWCHSFLLVFVGFVQFLCTRRLLNLQTLPRTLGHDGFDT